MEASQAQTAQQPDAATLGALLVILASGQSVAAMRDLAATLLAPYAIGAQALGEVLELFAPHLEGGLALPVPVGGLVRPPGSARAFIARTAFPRHAAYVVNAARRITHGGSLNAERRYMAQHLGAERGRRDAAQRVDAVVARIGPEMGWYTRQDSRVDLDCRRLEGTNFTVANLPAVHGRPVMPGTVHPLCRCLPGEPHPVRETRRVAVPVPAPAS
jgi:hypothetical protein